MLTTGIMGNISATDTMHFLIPTSFRNFDLKCMVIKILFFCPFIYNLSVADNERIEPQLLSVPHGWTGVISCLSTEATNWTFNDHDLPLNTYIIDTNSILILNASNINTGFYECKGNDGDTTFFARAKIFVSKCTLIFRYVVV